MTYAAINGVFRMAPASLVTWRHERRNAAALLPLLSSDPLFIHVPKSGGQSVAKALGQPEAGHFTFARMREIDPTVTQRAVYFSVLRDPRDRLLSTYWYIRRLHRDHGTTTLPQVHSSRDADDFVVRQLPRINVDNHYFLRPASLTLDGIPAERLYLVNFDNLASNFSTFAHEVLGRELTMPHVNSSARLDPEPLSTRSERVVEEIYGQDTAWHRALEGSAYRRLADITV